jgi:hypothetical protein
MNDRVEDFEKIILGDKVPKIKYTIDSDIESSVKYDFLCENFGKAEVDSELENSGMTFLDLADLEKYKTISEKLNRA